MKKDLGKRGREKQLELTDKEAEFIGVNRSVRHPNRDMNQ
jgi:hypothetical protein